MINSVVLIGRMTRQPELRITPNGVSVATFTLAVDRPPRGEDKQCDFIECVAWAKLADRVASWGDKGRLVAVEGRLQTRTYETSDKQRRKVVEVVAESVQFLDRRKEASEENVQ